MDYKPGKANLVADTLSHKGELAATATQPQSSFFERIREGMNHDAQAKQLLEMANKGKTWRFWIDDGLIRARRGCLFVPRWGNLRKEIMHKCYDSLWAAHPGVRSTMALVECAYYWPCMLDDIELYVKTCLIVDLVEKRVMIKIWNLHLKWEKIQEGVCTQSGVFRWLG
ncbi:uncharacterized protein LOC110671780 [Hevea brasiliensis]|uniref:uncharacterized protein LOC110671780 n=1 Tax=Hevea brasiliensis TaxID=3981 RepID=UPI0025E74EC9|nr:uncharacterized protein LOC110671780 [Hevea brasiliensis]